jgi:DNA-binding LacI/PurR family transcriptional regulator
MAAARRRAYTDTLRKAGRRIRRNHIIERGTRADFSAELDRLMGTDPAPDAVFCVYDELAMTVVDYLHAHGHAVPEEIAVATLADSSLAEKGYGLTTVAGNIPAEGARAMQIMLHRLGLRKGRRPGPWIRKRTLIARATT